MELTALLLSIAACAGFLVAALLWRGFLPAYAAEKAKNLAAKEDLAHLTTVVEGIRASHTAEIERLKSVLAAESQVTERRRCVYEEVCSALRVFVDGHENSDEAKTRFHSAYAVAWLWASDEAVGELNRFIALQRQHASSPSSVPQLQLKSAYVGVVLAMRKDAGFPLTTVDAASYQFVQFS